MKTHHKYQNHCYFEAVFIPNHSFLWCRTSRGHLALASGSRIRWPPNRDGLKVHRLCRRVNKEVRKYQKMRSSRRQDKETAPHQESYGDRDRPNEETKTR